jgi:hypothetical protein
VYAFAQLGFKTGLEDGRRDGYTADLSNSAEELPKASTYGHVVLRDMHKQGDCAESELGEMLQMAPRLTQHGLQYNCISKSKGYLVRI